MALQLVKFRDWEFEVDKEFNIATYAEIDEQDHCTCGYCENFKKFRDKVYPKEVLDLFNNLGIDYKKDVETFTINEDVEPLEYHGWFHFKGRILKGAICESFINSTPISDGFKIGFSSERHLTSFKNLEELVQINFSVFVPYNGDNQTYFD